MSDVEMEATVDDPLLSPSKVAAIFDVTPYTVRTWLKSGALVGVKLDTGQWRVPQSEVRRYANNKYGS